MSEEKYDVCISGMSGRFPECDDVNTYKKMLYNQESPITFDNRKWPTSYKYKFGETIPNGVGKYTQNHRFDARVFAVNRILAECTDVINRKVLEPSFEAIFDAGINPTSLLGANVGCYMACGINEADSIKFFGGQKGTMYLMGNAKSMESNRISFALNLTGPSVTFHGCVLGGLEALSTAYHNIAVGRIDAAIVGVASSVIDPKISVNFFKMGYLSPDSICRAFSQDANGYVRSEAAVCFYLQRAQDAKRNYAKVLFSECIYFGSNPNTFLGYGEDVIENTLQEMYSRYPDIKPSDVSYVEMDACGITNLEKIECNVISKLFCEERDSPLLVGSVKSHTGHTEASAGYISLMKALFALDSGSIAPNMHYTEPNSALKPLNDNKLKVVTETTGLPGSVVAVNSLGLSGLVGHIVLEQNPKTKIDNADDDKLPRLIVLCGRVENDLKQVIETIEKMPLDTNMIALINDIFKIPIPSHMYRAYSVLPAGSNPTNDVQVVEGENRPIWFLFSGMGSQWNGMGNGLLDIPSFANAIERCDKVLKPKGVDIYNILTSDDPALFDDIVNAFVGIIAVQVALVEVLNTIGIKPDGIIGHSLGENGCAYADGCLTLEQSVLASYARGVASKEVTTIKGMMAAIGKGYKQIADSLPDEIEVACHNSKDSCTLTGPADSVAEFVKELQEEKVFAKTVNVANIAYHSKHIAPAGPGLLRRLKEVIPEPKERSSKWISTSVPEHNWDSPLANYCSAEYLTNNLLNAVLFEEGCKYIPENAVVIEIAPHGLLQAILKRSFKPSVTNIPLTLRSQNSNAVNFLLSAVGKLFIAGCQPDVNALYPKIEYPVPRGTPNITNFTTWEHMDDWGTLAPLDDVPLSQELLKIRLNKGSEWRYLRSHKVKGQNIVPPSVYMYLTWHMLSVLRNEKLGTFDVVFEDIKVHKNLYVTIDKHRALTILIQTGSGNFEVLLENEKDPDNCKVVMTGIIQTPYEKPKLKINDITQKMKVKINQREFYKNLENIGYQLEDEFVNVKELSINETDWLGKITWNGNWVIFLDSIMKIHLYSQNDQKKETASPYRIRKLFISASEFTALTPGDELCFHRDLVTNRMLCGGLELCDFVSSPLPLDFPGVDEVQNELQQMQFIPHANPGLKDVNEFLNLCLQIAVERLSTDIQDSNISLSIIDTLGTVAPAIKKILKTFNYKPKIMYQTIRDVAAKNSSDNFYIITTDSSENADNIWDKIGNKLTNLFLLVIKPLNERLSWKNKKLFVEITRETFNDIDIYFYKKVPEPSEYPTAVIMADDSWMTKYSAELKTKKHEPFVILRNNVETTDQSLILSRRKPYRNTQFLYILDNSAPTFAIDNPIYQNQIAKDLPVLIFKDGQWGTYRNLKCEDNDNVFKEFDLVSPQDLHLQAVDTMYLNYDYQDISTDEKSQIREYEYGLEFSGISESGKRVMGLGYYNPLESLQNPDPLLTWEVPKSWSLEDAVTVPLLYSQAYYCIVLTPPYKEDQVVFVNSNLPFAEACIVVSLQRNYEIYVTVADDSEAEILKKKFPNLNEKYIILRTDGKYDIQLKLRTKGSGATIVINSMNGMKHTNSCLECISNLSCYIDIVDNYYPEDTELGLYTFLKSVAFNMLPNKISSLIQLPSELKKAIHDYIKKSINKGLIQPLSRIVINNNASDDYSRDDLVLSKKKIYKCNSKADIENDNSNNLKMKFKIDSTRSYLIIGGGKKSNPWFELLEWLISRGAKKFIVALDNFSLGTKISHQINRWLTQKKTTIILTSLKKIGSVEDASGLLTEANNIGPLEAVFVIALDPASTIAYNIDMASRSSQPFHFVCISSGGLKECEQRKKAGLPSVLIHSEKPINELTSLLPRIESIITNTAVIDSPTLYDIVDKSNKKGRYSFSLRLSQYLPNDLEGLENIGYHATDSLQFIEVATLSKPYAETKGVFPLFIIPGTDADQLKPILEKIHYPAFSTTFTERCESLTNIASELCKNIQQIQPHGPVTIIGETWSGLIAIEVGSLLQSSKRVVEVFLIEGSPATWQKHLKSIGEIDTPQFENNLLRQILDFDPTVNMEIENQTIYRTWEEHLNKYMNILDCSEKMKQNIVKTLNGVRNRLLMTAKYSPQGEILRHITLFKQRPSESFLDTYCLSDEMYLLEEEKFKEFIKIRKMSHIINENALFNWWK
ncbi:fatty acid synthase-like [Planococcus citri]|uniref:fatty acid synthase-like n=1 Tax=Planococcus citri TaxID=170843 RepID=UPI0031F79869